MKRILTFVLVIVAGLSVAVAQRSNHFTVDLNFNKSIKGDDGYEQKQLDFWGIAVIIVTFVLKAGIQDSHQ